MYRVCGKLLNLIKGFYLNSKACMKIRGERSNWFEIKCRLMQGCIKSLWLFNIIRDGVLREARVMFRRMGGENG